MNETFPFDLSDISSWFNSGHALSAGKLWRWCFFFQVSCLKAHKVHLALLGNVNFDHPAKVLSNFSNGKLLFFPLATNVGRHFETMKIFCPSAKLPPRFSIHWWSSPDLQFIAMAATCCLFQLQHALQIVSHYSALFVYIICLSIYLLMLSMDTWSPAFSMVYHLSLDLIILVLKPSQI